MSTGFGSLYYTDCVPGQGLQGGAGFQFQAATPGATTEAMGPVQRGALYEPPTAWMREQRPVSDYPRSLSHVANGDLYATAAGLYLGREANGSREGNQFTHAVVTRQAEDYGVHRPAQLWGATWWAEKPADGTELPELPAHPAPGPLDTETVQERLRTADGGRDMLTALVSALHHLSDPEQRRSVVLVTEEPERAACWLAGASLLLPRPAALAIGFKIFVADPQRGQHDVIALHPEWAGRWRSTDRGSGLSVFDLDVGRHSEVETTEAARFWVPRFLDEDPFDVVDAVELAGQFTGGTPAAGPDDRMIALVAAAGRTLDGRGETERAATWLRKAPSAATELVRDTVLDAVLESDVDAGVLRTLVAASSSAWGATAERLRGGLLTAEVAEVAVAGTGLDALTRLNGFEPLGSATATPRPGVVEIVKAVAALGVDRIPALCTLADRHGLALLPGWADADTMDRFARWWVWQTDPVLQHGKWPVPAELVDQVRDVLRVSLTASDQETRDRARSAIHRRWGPILWRGGADLSDPLDQALAGYAYGVADGSDRRKVLEQVLGEVARDGRPDPTGRAWTTLFDRAPSLSEVHWLLDGAHRRKLALSPVVIDAAHDAVKRAGEPTAETLAVAEFLIESKAPLYGRIKEIRELRAKVYKIERTLTERQARPAINKMADDLEHTPLVVLDAHRDTLAAALVAAVSTHALPLVARCGRDTLKPVYKGLERGLPEPGGGSPTAAQCRTAAFTFVLTGSDAASKEQFDDFRILRGHLAASIRELSAEDVARIENAHDIRLGKQWAEWVRDQQAGKFRRFARKVRPGKSRED